MNQFLLNPNIKLSNCLGTHIYVINFSEAQGNWEYGLKHTGKRNRTDHFLVNFGGGFTGVCFIITNVVTCIPFILLTVLSIIFQKSLITHKVLNRAQRKR